MEKDRVRVVGYQDNDELVSGLESVIPEIRARGFDVKRYQRLPRAHTKDFPDVMLLNSGSSPGQAYWNRVKHCIEAHPETRFVLLASPRQVRDYLGSQKNLQFFTILDGKAKLMALLES